MNTIPIYADSISNSARKMELGLLDGREDGDHNGLDFLEISEISGMQDSCYFGTGEYTNDCMVSRSRLKNNAASATVSASLLFYHD